MTTQWPNIKQAWRDRFWVQPISLAKFLMKTKVTTAVSQNKQKRFEGFKEILFLLIYWSVLNFTKKGYMLLKHHDLLACAVVWYWLSGLSSTFWVGWELISPTGRQNFFNWTTWSVNFPPYGKTSLEKLSSQPVSLPNTQPLMKPLGCPGGPDEVNPLFWLAPWVLLSWFPSFDTTLKKFLWVCPILHKF